MKILFVLGQLPYPPRNGVTIPTYNFLTGLARQHDVSLLLIPDGTQESRRDNLEENAALVDDLWVLNAPLKSRFIRIIDELAGKSIYHIGRQYEPSTFSSLFSDKSFDVVWISNSAIFDAIHPLKKVLNKDTIYVAGLNDSLTEGFRGAIYVMMLKGWTIRLRISLFFRWLRSWKLGPIEKKLLAPFDLILVQSAKDEGVLQRVSNGSLDKITILSNGVDQRLFSISQPGDQKNILFVGSLSGYSPLVELIIKKIWPFITERYSDATFTIIGRGASETLLKCISEDSSIQHIQFVDELESIYRNRMLAILPVRKSSGLINKVVESMASGIAVVGDSGSFNAIPEFEDGVHGIIADDVEDMKNAVIKLLSDDDLRVRIAKSANELVRKHFSWDDRVSAVEERLQYLINTRDNRSS